MTYTEEAKQALSRTVAEKFKLDKFYHPDTAWISGRGILGTWLHDDWHTIMELCVKHGVWASHMPAPANSVDVFINADLIGSTYYIDCASPSEAERMARLMALGELCGS